MRRRSPTCWLALAPCVAGVLLLSVALTNCGPPAPAPGNPVPSLTSLSPTTASAGGAGFSLAVNGSNFTSSSVVRWEGGDRVTSFVSSTELAAAITPEDIANGAGVQVTVFNPAPGGGTSNGLTFTIENPAPTLTSLSPASAVASGPEFALQVNGTNFVPSSVVRWNGSDRATTFVSSTELTATILASDVATTGTAQVSVFNPAPGGGTSGSLTFAIVPLQALAITTSRLPDTATGKVFDFTLAATGGTTPYFWGSPSTNLPGPFSLDGHTGRIIWHVGPGREGTTFNFTIVVMDSSFPQQTVSKDFSINVRPSPLARNDFCAPGSEAGTTRISNGTLRASFSPYGDVDVYSFQGTAGAEVTIETFAQRLDLDGNPATRDSQADTIVELLDSDCAQLRYSDDLSSEPHIQDSLINFTLPASDLYFIRVRDFRSDGRPELIYDLSLSGAD